MTLPDERYRAVKATEQLLKDLCNPHETPRVPKEVRYRAQACLRHYPTSWDMDQAVELAPTVFGKDRDRLYGK
jgi:hypothetical protein